MALGERLGLPLHAVEIPGHVFVRWDDGRVRMNWDPANLGASLTDETALRRFSNPPRAAQDAGVRVLGRRELVSVILSNEAWIRFWRDKASDDARRLAEDALRLDPANSSARLAVVAALARAEPPRPDDLRQAAERAASDATSDDHIESIADSLTRAGLSDDALALLIRRPAQEPRRWERRFVLADALCRAGRSEESIALAAPLSQERPSNDQIAALYASAAFGVSAQRGWTALARAATRRESDSQWDFDLGSRGTLLLMVARRLLDDAPATEERARLALDVADLLVAREDAPPVAHGIRRSSRNLAWGDDANQLSEVRARAWERLGDAAQAAQIREAVRSKRK